MQMIYGEPPSNDVSEGSMSDLAAIAHRRSGVIPPDAIENSYAEDARRTGNSNGLFQGDPGTLCGQDTGAPPDTQRAVHQLDRFFAGVNPQHKLI